MAYWLIQTRKMGGIHSSPLTTQMMLALLILNESQFQSAKQIYVSTYCYTKSPRIKSNFMLELKGKEITDLEKL